MFFTYGVTLPVELTGGLGVGGKQSMVKTRLLPLCYGKVDIYRRLVFHSKRPFWRSQKSSARGYLRDMASRVFLSESSVSEKRQTHNE